MTATTFNPLEAVRDLEAAGVERRQAEAIAEGMRRAAAADHDSLATKADIATLRWMFGFLAALNLAMAAKLFGVV